MHRAAFSFTVARLSSEEFSHHQPHVTPLRDAVVMSAMIADDIVVLLEIGAGPHRNGLLSIGQVDDSNGLSPGIHVLHSLFEGPYLYHLFQHPKQKPFLQRQENTSQELSYPQ